MKLLRYLVNTILFVVIWCIPAFLFVGISLSVSGTRPSAIAGVGGIVAIIISYRLVKRINKSNLWASLFEEIDVVNDVEEEKKVEVTDSNIFNPKNIIIAILSIVLLLMLYNQKNEDYNTKENEHTSTEKDNSKFRAQQLSTYVIDDRLNRYSLIDDIYKPEDLYGHGPTGAVEGPMLLKSSKQPVTGVVYYYTGKGESRKWYEMTVKNGNLNGVTKIWRNSSKEGGITVIFRDNIEITEDVLSLERK